MEFLNHMSYFVEVVKAKSFRSAAAALGMPNSTLSRKINELEKSVGLRLLHRTTRKIELTEAGQIYFERCRRIVDEARLAHEQLDTLLANPEGQLRISLPADFAIVVLTPIICQFSQRYPGISFDLDLAPRNVDLVSEPFDLAIRMGALPDSGLVTRKLGALPRYIYASPSYIKTKGMPDTPQQLAEHECLIMRSEKTPIWHLYHGEKKVSVRPSSRFQMNSIGMMRRLATMGIGLAVLPELIVADDVKHGFLERVLSSYEAEAVTIYALTETRLLPAKVRVFIEFIREHLQ